MINYFLIQLKSKSLGKKNLLIFIAVVFLSIALTYLYHSATEENIYKVGIIDYDGSETSKEFIQVLQKQKEIDLEVVTSKAIGEKKLKSGAYHILYTIKSDFEETLMAGAYENLLGYSKESSMQMTAWLNDFISLRVLKEWAYYDLYNIIKTKADNGYSYNTYQEAYLENLQENEIIALDIESLGINQKIAGEEKKIYLSIFSIFIMLVTMSYGKEVLNERQMNIVNRLKVSGISEVKYLMSKGLILWLYLLMAFIISAFGLNLLGVFKAFNFFIVPIFLSGFIIINYLVTLAFVYLLNEKGKYLLVTQGYILFSVLMSSDLFKGNLPVVNQLKGFFPLTYLLEMIL